MKDSPQLLPPDSAQISDGDAEQTFDLLDLREETEHPDDSRRAYALAARDLARRLRDLRLAEDGVSRADAWDHILDRDLLRADLESSDTERRSLAAELAVAVSAVAARREVMDSTEPTSIDVKVRAMALVIFAREKANELAVARGERVRASMVH